MNARPSYRPRTESVFGTLLVRGLAQWVDGDRPWQPLCDVEPSEDALHPWQQSERIPESDG